MFPKKMKLKNLHWILMSTTMILAMLCFTSRLPTSLAAAEPTTTFFVDPPQFVFTAATVNTTFTMNVTVANVTNLYGIEFTMNFNASLLSCTKMVENLYKTLTPIDEADNIWKLTDLRNNTAGYVKYAYTYMNRDRAFAGGYAPINITTAEFPEGKLAVAILTFNITYVPSMKSYAECPFYFNVPVKLGTPYAVQIPNTPINGTYRIFGPPETLSHSIVKDSTTYTITTASSATVQTGSMTYNASSYALGFNVTGADGTSGYVNVTVPKALVSLNNPATDHWSVVVNGTAVAPTITENATHTFVYVPLSFSTETISITGTIPEFQILAIIPLLIVVTLIATGLRRRRQI